MVYVGVLWVCVVVVGNVVVVIVVGCKFIVNMWCVNWNLFDVI